MLVSIIIPCYNAEKFISEAIKSCINQTYSNIEILVINDGSTDNSLSCLKEFRHCIQIINQENRGGAAARNAGLKISKGEYIKFLDADDILEDNIIEKQVLHFSEFNDNVSVAIYGDYKLINEAGGITGYCRQPIIIDHGSFGLSKLIDSAIITSAPLYRRMDLNRIKGFNETLKSSQEHELNFRLYLSGVKFVHFDDIVFYHRNYYSPTRISCRGWPYKDPLFMWNLINHYSYLLSTHNITIEENISSALASRLISAGRALIHAKKVSLANNYFDRAVKICPNKTIKIGNRYWIAKYYFYLVDIIGFKQTERLYKFISSVKTKLLFLLRFKNIS